MYMQMTTYNPDIDGVIFNAPTTQHYEVIAAAFQRRKQKVLALDYHQCKQLLALAEEREVNHPTPKGGGL
jgi:predicted dehydrogenase